MTAHIALSPQPHAARAAAAVADTRRLPARGVLRRHGALAIGTVAMLAGLLLGGPAPAAQPTATVPSCDVQCLCTGNYYRRRFAAGVPAARVQAELAAAAHVVVLDAAEHARPLRA